jgi:hypothetical protein
MPLWQISHCKQWSSMQPCPPCVENPLL